jgi:hypothetical protein
MPDTYSPVFAAPLRVLAAHVPSDEGIARPEVLDVDPA